MAHLVKSLAVKRALGIYNHPSLSLLSKNLSPLSVGAMPRNLATRAAKASEDAPTKDKTATKSATKAVTVEVRPAVIRKTLEDLKKKFAFPELPVASAYTHFLKENAAQMKHKGGINKDTMKQIAQKWRAMSDSDKKKLKEQVEQAKSSYGEAIQKWKNSMQARKLDNIVQQIDELTRSSAMRGRSQEMYLVTELERLKRQYKYPELKRYSPMSLFVQDCRAKAKPGEVTHQWLAMTTGKWKSLNDEVRATFVNKASQLNSDNRTALQNWKEAMEKQNLKEVVKRVAQLQRELRSAGRGDADKLSRVKVGTTAIAAALAGSLKNPRVSSHVST